MRSVHPLWAADLKRLGPFTPGMAPRCLPDEPAVWFSSRMRTAHPVSVSPVHGSAMDLCRSLAEVGAPGLSSVLVALQTRGRGQLGRRWESIPGNLHGAFIWPSSADVAPDLIPLAAGVLLRRAFESAGLSARIKWPNDLLVDGGKAAGVLVEERGGRTVIGVGVNLAAAPGPESMREESAFPALAVGERLAEYGPLRLWLGIMEAVSEGLDAPFDVAAEASLHLYGLGELVRDALGEPLRLMGVAPDGSPALAGADGGVRFVRHGDELRYPGG